MLEKYFKYVIIFLMGISCIKLSEKNIQAQCIDYLRITRWYVVENYRNTKWVPGVPDICAVRGGRTVWIEFKTEIGKQSECQKQFEQNIKFHGGEYIIVRSLEGLMEYLDDERIQGEMF